MEPLASWNPPAQRRDPLAVLAEQEQRRIPWLLPIRHSRMATNLFAHVRGSAATMAADLASQPSSGVLVQLCGDAHLLNFGFYASPERSLLFDIAFCGLSTVIVLLAPVAAPPRGSFNRGAVVCNCFDVAASEIDAVLAGGADLKQLQQRLKCGTECGSCVPELKRLCAQQDAGLRTQDSGKGVVAAAA